MIWAQSNGRSVSIEMDRDSEICDDLWIRGMATFIFISSPDREVLW